MKIFTDGACSQGGTQNGGWGVVVTNLNDELIHSFSGNKEETTNNEMELTAFLSALMYVNELEEVKEKVTILTDSAYIYNAVTSGWIESWKARGWRRPRNQELAHREIWIKIDYLISMIRDKTWLSFEKVKGHSTNKGNNMADALATKERDILNRGV